MEKELMGLFTSSEMFYQMVFAAIAVSWFMLQFLWEYWYLSMPILLIEYLVIMKLWLIVKGHWYEKPFKIIFGIIFIPQDILVNVFCTVLFLDPPKHLLVTDRMQRYINTYGASSRFGIHAGWLYDWRFQFAGWLCGLLNPSQQRLDGTNHCVD